MPTPQNVPLNVCACGVLTSFLAISATNSGQLVFIPINLEVIVLHSVSGVTYSKMDIWGNEDFAVEQATRTVSVYFND